MHMFAFFDSVVNTMGFALIKDRNWLRCSHHSKTQIVLKIVFNVYDILFRLTL